MAVNDINDSPAVGTPDAEKSIAQVDVEATRDEKADVQDDASSFKQEGVQQVEAIAQVWSKRTIIVMFIL